MTDVSNPKCSCGKHRPNFGFAGVIDATHCSKCKEDGMIDIKNTRCVCGKASPTYGLITNKNRTCCKECKTTDMIDIMHIRCLCKKSQPVFGLITDEKPTCCAKCKKENMINIKDKRCICNEGFPIYGLITDKIATCCPKCKTKDMVNIKTKKCLCGKNIPSFGYENDKTETCCTLCKKEDMIDIKHKRCQSNYLTDDKKFYCAHFENRKYDGHCTHCFSNLFPNDPRTKMINKNSKEIIVRNFINSIFDGFQHDKALWTGNCNCTHRRRIDHRKLIGNTLLCVGTDEFQHKYYDDDYEKLRYEDLMMIHGGKFIYIRFNPDQYKENGKKKNPLMKTRLIALEKEMNKQIKRIENEENNELLEIIPMYYDS